MRMTATTRESLASFSEAMFAAIDKMSAVSSDAGFGIVGDSGTQLNVTVAQALSCMQITPGSFITPDGTICNVTELVTGLFPHSWKPGSTGVVLGTYTTSTNTSTDEYGREIVESNQVGTVCMCVPMDDYGDNISTWYPKSVVLAVYAIVEGAIDLDGTAALVPNTRKVAGSVDRKHRSLGYTDFASKKNVHGTQVDDIYASESSLLRQLIHGGFILGGKVDSQGTPGSFQETEIPKEAWRIDYLGSVTGMPGQYYALLPMTPTAFGTAVDATYMDVPADVSWIEKQNIVVTDTPAHVVIRYLAMPDFDLAAPVISSSVNLNNNTTKIAASQGKLLHKQSTSRRISAGLDPYKDLTLDRVSVHVNKAGTAVLCPQVVESAVVSASLAGSALTSKTTLPSPSQVTFAVRGAGLASAQEPPAGAIRVKGSRFIGTSNLTFTVSNEEERTSLSATVGNTVILQASTPLHPCGSLQLDGLDVPSARWRRVDDYTVAMIPLAYSSAGAYEWVLPAGESPRWVGRSIQAVGTATAPAVAKATGWVQLTALPVEGDTLTVTTTENEATLTCGTDWVNKTDVRSTAQAIVTALAKSEVAPDVAFAVIVDGTKVFIRCLSRSLSPTSNNWTIDVSGSSMVAKSFYGGGPYSPHATDLQGLNVAVLYQQTPYIKKPKINVYVTKSIVDDSTATEKNKFHKLYSFDASDKRTVWRSHTMTRADLIMSDYDDRDGYDITTMFNMGITVTGYDAAGGTLSESITIDDVDTWNPTYGYSDQCMKSTTNVFSSITSWIVSSAPPSVSNITLYVMSNVYDAPHDMLDVRTFKLENGKPLCVQDTRKVRIGIAVANEPSEHEQLHQALTMQNSILSIGGLL